MPANDPRSRRPRPASTPPKRTAASPRTRTDPAKRIAAAQAVFEALSHPSRRQILLIIRLRGDEMTAGAIADRFRFAWPTITRHLAVLQQAGLITQRKAGRERLYRVDTAPLAHLQEWLDVFASHRSHTPPAWSKLGFGTMRNTVHP